MNARLVVLLVLSLAAGCGPGGPLGDSNAPPSQASPSASATPSGVIGNAELVVQTALFSPDNSLTIGGHIAFEQRDRQLRIDVISITIPGMNPTAAAVTGAGAQALQLFPAGGFTVVLDQHAMTYTVWSNAKGKYFTGKMRPPATPGASPAPTPKPTPSVAPSAAPFDPLTAFKMLKNIKTFSLALKGHGTTNGHPSTEYDFQIERDNGQGDTFESHGQFQLADDLDEFPVQIQASAKGKTFPTSSVRLDLSRLERRLPPREDFVVPRGYTQAQSPQEVFGN
jgi:predicted small lipoprotein YifL